MKKGQWVAMTIENVKAAIKGKADLEAKYQTQADVLVYADEASILLGGTPTDRPEDVEISVHSIKQSSLHIQTMTDMVTSMVILQDLSKTIMILVH